MYIKNGQYKVTNYKEYHAMPNNKSKRIRKVNQEKEIEVEYHYNILAPYAAFIVGAFAPLPIEWKIGLIITVLSCGLIKVER